MKNTFIISLLMLAFCFMAQTSSAQEKADINVENLSEEDKKKDELIKKYAWTKAHFENSTDPVLTVMQMISSAGHEYVLVESKASKTLYDNEGKRYCADHASLDCVEYYKLSAGDLAWSKS